MATEDESLMDVFVNVRPDEQVLAATEGLIDAAVQRIREKFLGLHNTSISQAKVAADVIANIQVKSRSSRGSGAPGSAAAGNDEAERFRAASRAVQDLQEEVRQLGTGIKQIGAEEITKQFELASNEVRRLQVEIGRNAQDNDILGLEKTLQQLDLAAERVRQIQVTAGNQRNVRQEFNAVVAQERQNRAEESIRDRLQTSLTRGQPSAEIRAQIIRARAEVKLFEAEFDRLVRDFDGSSQHLDKLVAASRNLAGSLEDAGGRRGLQAIQQTAQASTRSMNTLTNNAYQLGQAFEDAAVGFSLNGITGAIRGASNNVSFLINNFIQAKTAAGGLSASMAGILNLSAGIAVAAGFFLPRLIEWLESLNDIETKTKDIGDEMQRIFEDAEFNIKLGIKETDLARTLSEATDLDPVIDALRRLNVEAETGKRTIREMFQEFEDQGGLDKARNNLRELIGVLASEADKIEARRLGESTQAPLSSRLIRAIPGANSILPEASLEAQQELQKSISLVADAVQQFESVRLKLKAGPIDPVQIEKSERALRAVTDQAKELLESADAADQAFGEKLISNLTPFADGLKQMKTLAKEYASIIETQVNTAIEKGAEKVDVLRSRLELMQSQTKGLAREQALLLFDLEQQTKEYEKQIESSEDLTALQKRQFIELERQRSIIALQVREVDLRDDLAATEEKILDLRERQRKSQFITIDEFTRKIQIDAFKRKDPQQEQLDKLLKQREAELAAIAQGDVAQRRIGQGRPFGDLGVPFRDGFMAAPVPGADKRINPFDEAMERAIIKGFFDMVEQQKKTNEQLEKLDIGARAG